MSDSNGVDLPPLLTSVERVPFRSLQNHLEPLQSTPLSKRQSRSLAANGGVFKTTTREESKQPSKENDNSDFKVDNVSVLDASSTACSGSDITFKSFACAGGEIEISGHSAHVAEDSIVLPPSSSHQPSDTCLQGDATIADSMVIIHELGNCHVDHAYCNPEDDHEGAMNHTEPPTEQAPVPSFTSTNADAQQEPAVVNGDRGAEWDVTFKSFVCDRGEVEVLNTTTTTTAAGPLSEVIPLPKDQLGDQRPDHGDSMSVPIEECGDGDQQDHVDHLYGRKECGFSCSFAQNPKRTDGPPDVTLKSFVCTGGEVEISDGTTVEVDEEETVPLPSMQLGMSNYSANDESIVNQSVLAANQITEPSKGHLEHCYFNAENLIIGPSASGLDLEAPQTEPLPGTTEAPQLEEHVSLGATDGGTTNAVAFDSPSGTAGDVTPTAGVILLEKPVSLLEDPGAFGAFGTPESHDQESRHQQPCALKGDERIEPAALIDSVVADAPIPAANIAELQDVSRPELSPAEESAGCCAVQASTQASTQSPQSSNPVPVEGRVMGDNEGHLRSDSGAQSDSALGMSSGIPAGSGEKEPVENSDVMPQLPAFLSAVPQTLQFELLTPVAGGTPLARVRTHRDSPLAKYLADCLESPMPRPMFNSTALGASYASEAPSFKVREVPERKPPASRCSLVATGETAVTVTADLPLIPHGPLQQQLRQMAELLILASGKMSGAGAPLPVESREVAVGTSPPPPKVADCCINTSGQFERKREFSVADACTVTDPLQWHVPPGSLEGLAKPELEQRLRSSMIMVEALAQQLDATRCQRGPAAATGPPPSQLRDTPVQTDHTELDQTSTYRGLYTTALERIQELEMDLTSLQSLIQAMQGTKITMGLLNAETDAAISAMQQREQAVRESQCSLRAQYGKMKGLCGRFQESHGKMLLKVRDALAMRDEMRRRMEEAFSAREAAFSVTEQLRVHCAQQLSEMEESVGCHRELMAALGKAYPQQVALNRAYVGTLDGAFDLVSRTRRDQSSLAEELSRVRALLHKATPTMLKLNQKAAAALSDRDRHRSDRDRAVEERLQMAEALERAHGDLRDAGQQIGDLNIQVTIMNSELGVLREKLSEGEEERAQLERKVTLLSATVSSTLASYSVLEQAIAEENAMLQQSRKDHKQAADEADQLEALLGPSEQRVRELSAALAQSKLQQDLLQDQAAGQAQHIQQLGDTCAQLSSVREMNEFLQMENEVVREQVVECEGMFQANLQNLHERNIQCEDLKAALGRLQLENAALEASRRLAEDSQRSLGEQLLQGVTTVTVEIHKLKLLTGSLHAPSGDLDSQPSVEVVAGDGGGVSQATTPAPDRRQLRNSSFVDDVMVALNAEKEQEEEQEEQEEEEEERDDGQQPPRFDGLFSERSAFKPVVTPKKVPALRSETESDSEAELGSGGDDLPSLLPELSATVSELVSALGALRQRKDSQLEELRTTVCGLQREQQAAARRQREELLQLATQLEKGNLALQQKTQDEKTLSNLMADVSEARETLSKFKTENLGLRQVLQRSQAESRALRDELRRAGPESAGSTGPQLDQKIQLLQEVERLKQSLLEAEQFRNKLLEKTKRHRLVYQANEQRMESELRMLDNMLEKARKTLMSVPDVVQGCEELQKLVDYIC